MQRSIGPLGQASDVALDSRLRWFRLVWFKTHAALNPSSLHALSIERALVSWLLAWLVLLRRLSILVYVLCSAVCCIACHHHCRLNQYIISSRKYLIVADAADNHRRRSTRVFLLLRFLIPRMLTSSGHSTENLE